MLGADFTDRGNLINGETAIVQSSTLGGGDVYRWPSVSSGDRSRLRD